LGVESKALKTGYVGLGFANQDLGQHGVFDAHAMLVK